MPLLVAAAGAAVILLGFFSTVVELAGVIAIFIGTVLSLAPRGAPEPEVAGVRWWRLLATGALITLLGVPLSLGLETLGGLLAGFGAALVVVAVAFGWPR
ncbi:MAG: hypothetical protein ABR536_07180 [Solirubrobacterales bacterium]